MKNIKCILGIHSLSLASTEVKITEAVHGHLICRVRNCCVNCGKEFEDIISIPLPEWLLIGGTKVDEADE